MATQSMSLYWKSFSNLNNINLINLYNSFQGENKRELIFVLTLYMIDIHWNNKRDFKNI